MYVSLVAFYLSIDSLIILVLYTPDYLFIFYLYLVNYFYFAILHW